MKKKAVECTQIEASLNIYNTMGIFYAPIMLPHVLETLVKSENYTLSTSAQVLANLWIQLYKFTCTNYRFTLLMFVCFGRSNNTNLEAETYSFTICWHGFKLLSKHWQREVVWTYGSTLLDYNKLITRSQFTVAFPINLMK